MTPIKSQPSSNNSDQVKVAMRALSEAVWRLESVLQHMPIDNVDAEGLTIFEILIESGKKSVGVAYSAIEKLEDLGMCFPVSEGERPGVFAQAYEAISNERRPNA